MDNKNQKVKLNKPKISVVVASHNALSSVKDCLGALQSQNRDGLAEIVVVDNSTDGTKDIIKACFGGIELISLPATALIPELWAKGIQHSKADIVALTTSHFVPKHDWLSQILKAHSAAFPAVGGAIENDRAAGIVDSAVYFCRYYRYMPPFAEQNVTEIAGDNAAYKRKHIDRYQHIWREGFWEPAVHAELKKDGLQLRLIPSVVVYHKRSFGFWGFVKQRFKHGRQFGSWRASRLTKQKHAVYALISPAIPIVLFLRAARQALPRDRYRWRFMVAAPVLFLFFLSWGFGELVGYILGASE